MARTHWYDVLLRLLRDYPGEMGTVTLTLTELEAVVRQPLPPVAGTRSYWWSRAPGSMGPRLAAIGWRVDQAHRYEDFTITFGRRLSGMTG